MRGNTGVRKTVNVRRGDIYYADLSPVVGSEQGGVRPVLIVQNDVGNRFSPPPEAGWPRTRLSCWSRSAPLTSGGLRSTWAGWTTNQCAALTRRWKSASAWTAGTWGAGLHKPPGQAWPTHKPARLRHTKREPLGRACRRQGGALFIVFRKAESAWLT